MCFFRSAIFSKGIIVKLVVAPIYIHVSSQESLTNCHGKVYSGKTLPNCVSLLSRLVHHCSNSKSTPWILWSSQSVIRVCYSSSNWQISHHLHAINETKKSVNRRKRRCCWSQCLRRPEFIYLSPVSITWPLLIHHRKFCAKISSWKLTRPNLCRSRSLCGEWAEEQCEVDPYFYHKILLNDEAELPYLE